MSGDNPADALASSIKDPIAFELFKNSLFSIADEMALTICRTTYSGVLRDNMDFSTAFADANGMLVAQGLTLPGHLGSIPTALDVVVNRFEDDINPGDLFILNDPFDGGMHLPDIFIFKPIFVGETRIAFAATICHHADVGGRVPGSNASDSTEIYQEGLRIPPLKLADRGKRNDTIWAFIERNVRVPVQVFGDLRAQLAACSIAERQFLELGRTCGSTCRRSSITPSASPARRCGSSRTGSSSSRTGSTTTESTSASPSACCAPCARRATACGWTGPAAHPR
jgi:N-methylhydantoinase B